MAAKGRRSRQIQRGRRNDRIRGHDPAHQGAAGAGRGNGEPDRPATGPTEGSRGRPALIVTVLDRPPPHACAAGDLVARIGPPCWGLLADSYIRACCRSSVVEHSIGNGEVESSILSGSTISTRACLQLGDSKINY